MGKVLTVVSPPELNLLVYLEAINEKKDFPGIQFSVDDQEYEKIKERIKNTWNQIIAESKQFNSVGRYDEIVNNILASLSEAKRKEIIHCFKTWWLQQPKHGFGYMMEQLVFQLGRDELLRISGSQHHTIVLVFDDPPANCQQQDESGFIIMPLHRFYFTFFEHPNYSSAMNKKSDNKN
ncbi:DUF4423 domain-containing protein [Sporosarcina cyprini]|uniref:DUF4423 domain-containing protein n=1 Tax=Sporosarcina cyprini TaxID=2910523 RepID=UPI001EDF07AB|nr:DUF4423 domain-containing protein [Sporosarcina cyprini]MCG3088921.1 DUF4423 domain-containing protein [Sporosarcina cyprini]